MKPAHTVAEAIAYRAGYAACLKHARDKVLAELRELRKDKRRLDAIADFIKSYPLMISNELNADVICDMEIPKKSLQLHGRTLRAAIDDMRGTKR